MAEVRAVLVLVDDVDRAVTFYQSALGMEVVRRFDDPTPLSGRLAELRAGGTIIWFYDGLPTRPKAPYPVLLMAVDDLEAARALIEQHGGTITSDLRSDILGDHYIFTDTEGNILEIRANAPSA